MNNNLQTLKGFRDFLPKEKREREYVRKKIVQAFRLAGFEPLETPTLEYKETIMGKYGEEADKLVYEFTDLGGREVAMRYDQTVPTARVISQYRNELPLPFRRYQIQNVFRADKPQKGRYREFTQCDIDIFGSDSPTADAEVLAVTYLAYKNIGFRKIELKVNDRRALTALLEPYSSTNISVASIIQTLDKLDKLDKKVVVEELQSKGLSSETANEVLKIVNKLQPSKNLQEIIELAQALGVPSESLVFTPTLARGLDYYTGMIFEVVTPDYEGGALGGGGRYDNLLQQLSGYDVPAVGIGIGFDRTVEAAKQLRLVPREDATSQVLVTVLDEKLRLQSAIVVSQLRDAGVPAELYPDEDKLGKQLKYASRSGIPFVIILGDEEQKKGVVTLRNMISGNQDTFAVGDVIDQVKK